MHQRIKLIPGCLISSRRRFKMKKAISVLVLLILLTAGISYAQQNNVINAANTANGGVVKTFENLYKLFMNSSLPDSLDIYFQKQKPEVPGNEYLGEMFTEAGAFEGIVTNLKQGDMANATVSYNVFANEYKNTSMKIPEWKEYFDIKAVDKLGSDLNASNVSAAFKDIGTIGSSCGKCHADRQPQVWAKYYWRNFDTVNVSTSHGNLSWAPAMSALAEAFDGIGANAAKGNQTETNKSFNHFKALYKDVKTACKNCHDTPRYYYVSKDVFTKIKQMGQNITAGNLQAAQANQQELGIQCYKCHVLHMPAQDMKDKMGK
jgi:cytochrome c556